MGTTFQQMMDTVFGSQIGRNVQVYVDDMITKSKQAHNHVVDLRETFENVRRHNVRLKPTKCSFGLTSGKFLGFLISQRGIEADLIQMKAITEMQDLTWFKEVQKLIGCIAALRRFIRQASKKCAPFFRSSRRPIKLEKFCGTTNADRASPC